MGDGVFWQVAARLALPVALQNLLVSSFALVDTVMVGQLGDVALSSVGMAGQINWLMTLFLFGVASGASVFFAQYWGAGHIGGIHKVFGISAAAVTVVSFVFMLAGLFASGGLIGIFNRTPEVVESGSAYLRIACLSYPATALNICFGTVLRSTERVRLPMYTCMFSAVLNAALNYALIFGNLGFPRLGVRGAAVATVVSSWAGVILLFAVAVRTDTVMRARPADIFGFDGAMLGKFVRVASPVIINESMWGLGTLIYNVIFARLGYENYAAVTMCRTVESIFFVFFVGLCNACCIMVGKSVGAGMRARAMEDSRRFAVIVPLLALATGALVAVFRSGIIYVFDFTGSLSPATISTAEKIILVYAAELCLRMIPYIQIVGIFRSGGDTLSGMRYDLFNVWCVALPLTAVSAFVLKIPFAAVFAVMLFGEDITKTVMCVRRFRSMKWIKPVTESKEVICNESQ